MECPSRWDVAERRGEKEGIDWDSSSVGRALVSHIRGQGFDSPLFHIFIIYHTLPVLSPSTLDNCIEHTLRLLQ